MMNKFDDIDKAFGLGTIFGIGVTAITVSISTCVRIIKSRRCIKKAVSDLFRELDESISENI